MPPQCARFPNWFHCNAKKRVDERVKQMWNRMSDESRSAKSKQICKRVRLWSAANPWKQSRKSNLLARCAQFNCGSVWQEFYTHFLFCFWTRSNVVVAFCACPIFVSLFGELGLHNNFQLKMEWCDRFIHESKRHKQNIVTYYSRQAIYSVD